VIRSNKQVVIYTDGACSGNPGPGGWGAVLMYGDVKKEISGGEPMTTNNRMELMAAIQALESLKEPVQVRLHTDSAYLVNCFHQGWHERWERNGWRNSKKEPVENRDLWERMLALTRRHSVEFVKVKGHSNDVWNNRCDELARAAARAVSSRAR
jgi:ribonuclease HI